MQIQTRKAYAIERKPNSLVHVASNRSAFGTLGTVPIKKQFN